MDILQFLNQYLPLEVAVVLTAAFPIIELRGAIPLAMALGMPVYKAFLLSFVGNLIPIAPLLLLLDPVTEFLTTHFKIFRKFFDWLHVRTLRKSDKVDKYGALGLIFFTAVPLPTTGAWTACLAAVLFKVSFFRAFIAIASGVLIAGIGITLVSSGIF